MAVVPMHFDHCLGGKLPLGSPCRVNFSLSKRLLLDSQQGNGTWTIVLQNPCKACKDCALFSRRIEVLLWSGDLKESRPACNACQVARHVAPLSSHARSRARLQRLDQGRQRGGASDLQPVILRL